MSSPPPFRPTRRLILAALPLVAAGMARAGTPAGPFRLMMVTRRGCRYCEAWDAEIGPGYAASPAGRLAPLLVVDMDGPFPDGLALDRRPRLTPSFLLLDGSVEIGRIEGYVGARHFYPVLTRMMVGAGLPQEALS